MTGAGSAEVAFASENSYGSLPADPTYYQPGIDVEVSEASLDNALTRARQPDDPRPAGSREGNLEGALSVTFTLTDTNFHDLVFADAGTALASEAMLAPTATWYLGADVLGSTEERFLAGAAVESVTWNWQQGEDVTVDLTIIYGTEKDLTTPASITQPSVADAVPSHACDVQLDATSVSKLQSFSLEVAGMARFRRGQQREPVDAVVGAYEPSASLQAILEDGTRREFAYGSSTATTPQDSIDKQSGSFEVANSSGTVATYNLSGLQPTSYNWSDLVAADTDITDPTDFHVTDIAVA